VSLSQGIPRSRIYWELKADQVFNDISSRLAASQAMANQASASQDSVNNGAGNCGAGYNGTGNYAAGYNGAIEPAIEVVVLDPPVGRVTTPPGSWQASPIFLLGLAGMGMAGLLVAGIGLGLWSQSLQTLRQEQNLMLLDRLRNFGPAGSAPISAAPAPLQAELGPGAAPSTGSPNGPDLPPPPNEPWMQQLASLPGGQLPAAQGPQLPARAPATVGATNLISRPAPAVTVLPYAAPIPPRGGPGSGPTPQLLGLVQAPGHSAAAIFQVGSSSSTASIGERIGDTGWRLRSASGDGVVVERGGEQRYLSLSSDS
jgi:hypothetical protein